jgi:hypothetical protein
MIESSGFAATFETVVTRAAHRYGITIKLPDAVVEHGMSYVSCERD